MSELILDSSESHYIGKKRKYLFHRVAASSKCSPYGFGRNRYPTFCLKVQVNFIQVQIRCVVHGCKKILYDDYKAKNWIMILSHLDVIVTECTIRKKL
jgi:hypothetical protein